MVTDGYQALTGAGDGSLNLVELSGNLRPTVLQSNLMPSPSSALTSIEVKSDSGGKEIVTGYGDGTVLLWSRPDL